MLPEQSLPASVPKELQPTVLLELAAVEVATAERQLAVPILHSEVLVAQLAAVAMNRVPAVA